MRRTYGIRKWYTFTVVTLFLLCAIIVLPFFSVNAEHSIDSMTKYLSRNFEKYTVTEDFSSDVYKDFADYISSDSRVKVVSDDLSIDGFKSLAINTLECEWSDLNLNKEKIAFRMSVKIDSNFHNTMNIIFETQDSETGISLDAGRFLTITSDHDESGITKTILQNHRGELLAELNNDIRYKITAYFTKGSNTYDVIIEGNDAEENIVKKDNLFVSDVYIIKDLRLLVSDDSDSSVQAPYIRIDNLELYVKEKAYAQQYSSQSKGSIDSIKVPEISEDNSIAVYVNNTKIHFPYQPMIKNGKVYVDAVTLYKCLGFKTEYDVLNAKYSFENENVLISGSVSDTNVMITNKLTQIEQVCTLSSSPVAYEDTLIVSSNFINETINAKIWFDESSSTFVITTGENKRDNILKAVNGMLFMNGEPYYEISFNKYDLFRQILAEYVVDSDYPDANQQIVAAEAALADLHADGFRSIRVFCSSDLLKGIMYDSDEMNLYFKAMDRMFELCNKYDIKVVVCLNLISDIFTPKQYISKTGWISMDETIIELVSDENSISRQNLYKFIDKLITRYKDEEAVLMWELHNEGNTLADIGSHITKVCYSVLQLGDFYRACSDRIRAIDSVRLISSGDSILKAAQMHLLNGVLRGDSQSDWNTDNKSERLTALWILNNNLDVVSAHTYSIGNAGLNSDSIYIDDSGILSQYGFAFLRDEATKIFKPLYCGESAGTLDSQLDNYVQINLDYINNIVDSKVQLTHWWTFRSDKIGDQEISSLQCDSGLVYDAIRAANAELKSRYIVNGAQQDNTNNFWNDPYFSVVNEANITDGQEFLKSISLKNKIINFSIIAFSLINVAIVLLIITTKFNFHKETDNIK